MTDLSQLTFRPATLADHETVRALMRDIHDDHARAAPYRFRVGADAMLDDHYRDIVTQPERDIILAELKGKPVGMVELALAVMPVTGGEPERLTMVEVLVVDPALQRRGIARLLMQHAADWAASHDAPDLELNVYTFNADAMRFYERLGFAVTFQRMRLPANTRHATCSQPGNDGPRSRTD